MSRREELERQQREIREFEREQRNAAIAEKLLTSDGVDDPLFKGSRDAPLVQRIGAVILGTSFFLAGVTFASLGVEKHNWIVGIFSAPWLLLGVGMVQSAFKRKRSSVPSH